MVMVVVEVIVAAGVRSAARQWHRQRFLGIDSGGTGKTDK